MAGERESNGLRGEVNQMAATLSHIRDELKTAEKNTEKTSAENLKQIEKLEKEKEKLLKQLNESNSNSSSMGEKSVLEIKEMKRKMEQREGEVKEERRAREEAQRVAIETFRDKHMTELEAERAVQSNLKTAAGLKQGQLQVGS